MLREPDIVERVFAFLTLESFRYKVSSWLANRFKVDTFELQGDVIVERTGWKRRVPLSSIKTWKIYPEMGVDVVAIELQDGTSFNWLDKHNDLIEILETKVSERKKEWLQE